MLDPIYDGYITLVLTNSHLLTGPHCVKKYPCQFCEQIETPDLTVILLLLLAVQAFLLFFFSSYNKDIHRLSRCITFLM